MKKIGIFYGSQTGTTEQVAQRIASMLGVSPDDVHNVAKSAPSDVASYDILVLGSSTWGSGDLETDWEDFLTGIEPLYLPGKTIAIFGCGDETMSDTFCNAVGTIYSRLQSTGASFIKGLGTEGYDFQSSSAILPDGSVAGLLLDQVNHPELTDLRLRQWTASIADAAR